MLGKVKLGRRLSPGERCLSNIVIFTLVALIFVFAGFAHASVLVPQTPIDGSCIPQFSVPMPVFGPAGSIPRVNAINHPNLTVTMKETEQQVLPPAAAAACGLSVPFGKTRVWAYEISDTNTGQILGPANWPAVTVEARRSKPTIVTYRNRLPSFDPSNPFGPGLVQGLISTDQSLHWADPVGSMCEQQAVNCLLTPLDPCCSPFIGPPPTVPHLHGGEVPSEYDGGPTAWFTSDGKTGAGYRTLAPTVPGNAIYEYNNSQEPGTLWFHDHALGATRTNVYSGMAAFYFLREPNGEPANLPSGAQEIEIAFQDRQFDSSAQLFFPDGSGVLCGSGQPGDPCLNGPPTNPDVHVFWNPEFIGDVSIVNGVPWPYLNVKPKRYRLRLLDGANARVYNLSFGPVPVYQIGADDNYLDRPVRVNTVSLAPGERADVIVDFTNFAGRTITVANDAPIPFPDGLSPVPRGELPADQPQMASIMQFRVSSLNPKDLDTSCNPAIGGCARPRQLVRLTDGNGNIVPGLKIDKVRQLVLIEHSGPGGPLEVLLNNTKWDGSGSPTIDLPGGISEQPRIGSVEMWEIINATADAHPIHTHLVQFQILNRESYDFDGSLGSSNPSGYGYVGFDNGIDPPVPGEWARAFGPQLPARCDGVDVLNPCPGYGPPRRYSNVNVDGAIGGNPAIGPYLLGDVTPPAPEESGFKDTAKSMPGQVLRLIIRWAPTSAPVTPNTSTAGTNLYPFDPTTGPGYVWHCHIIDHEDNEMMRPYLVLADCPNGPINVGASYYSVFQNAYNALGDGQTAFMQAVSFAGNMLLQNNVSVRLEGGYSCDYSTNPGYTTINGSITISGGSVVMDRVIIQ
jgi:spore coat protein A, manganese oxidase